jgi:hypothetical protein
MQACRKMVAPSSSVWSLSTMPEPAPVQQPRQAPLAVAQWQPALTQIQRVAAARPNRVSCHELVCQAIRRQAPLRRLT